MGDFERRGLATEFVSRELCRIGKCGRIRGVITRGI